MKMYRTERYRINAIDEVEVTRATAKTVWYVETWWGKTEERRALRKTDSAQYHETWEGAKTYLLEVTNRRLEYLQKDAQRAAANIEIIKALKKPTN